MQVRRDAPGRPPSPPGIALSDCAAPAQTAQRSRTGCRRNSGRFLSAPLPLRVGGLPWAVRGCRGGVAGALPTRRVRVVPGLCRDRRRGAEPVGGWPGSTATRRPLSVHLVPRTRLERRGSNWGIVARSQGRRAEQAYIAAAAAAAPLLLLPLPLLRPLLLLPPSAVTTTETGDGLLAAADNTHCSTCDPLHHLFLT